MISNFLKNKFSWTILFMLNKLYDKTSLISGFNLSFKLLVRSPWGLCNKKNENHCACQNRAYSYTHYGINQHCIYLVWQLRFIKTSVIETIVSILNSKKTYNGGTKIEFYAYSHDNLKFLTPSLGTYFSKFWLKYFSEKQYCIFGN